MPSFLIRHASFHASHNLGLGHHGSTNEVMTYEFFPISLSSLFLFLMGLKSVHEQGLDYKGGILLGLFAAKSHGFGGFLQHHQGLHP